MSSWNLWHGCQRYSEGCKNCYVYNIDSGHGKSDSFIVRKNADFGLPLKKDRSGNYKLRPENGAVFTCMTSDFFIEDADCWREDAWKMMKLRPDLEFIIVTKRITQAAARLPDDWGEGYGNVSIAVTMENQRAADSRLKALREFPARRKIIFCSPLLEEIIFPDLSGTEYVTVGGESGNNARICRWEWIESVYRQCAEQNVGFHLHQLGAAFEKDGRIYRMNRKEQFAQAKKAEERLKSLSVPDL